ncbi:hypothetical protein I316_05952 [Kwoniella heveanensis BCC8398]|uniref:Uncharacterized protein n=1 Tax=Kwoniella heveanensis BCC8398 TaxID=1296120 RepID=A0A1B9GMD4_9TREE|nr:hypothetical protein I316_05952 [Kwoniella heveanensis BCC8398]
MRPTTALLSLPLSAAARPSVLSSSLIGPSLRLRTLSSTRSLLDASNSTEPSRPPSKHIANPNFKTDRPVKITHKPVFPAPHNPFAPEPEKKVYNDITIRLLRQLNIVLGYNRRRRTTARETGRMMKGIIEAVEADKAFWYGECDLPRTFHTFFTIHYLYVVLTLTRLRALHNSIPNPLSPLPQSAFPGAPGTTPAARPPSILDTLDNLGCSLSHAKQHDYRYQQMLLTHYFNIVENEIRLMLGVEITRETETMKRLREYQERGNFARMGLDYSLGLSISTDPEERERADSELASWVWRFIFARRGTDPAQTPSSAAAAGKDGKPAATQVATATSSTSARKGTGDLVYPEGEEMKAGKDLEMAEQIELIVRFMRRELHRLDGISDRDVIAGNVGFFGKVRS